MTRPIPAIFIALALFVTACGGDSGDEAVVKALQADILRDPTFDDYEIQEEEAECVARASVEQIGAERMIEIGIEDEETELEFDDLTDEEITVIGDAMSDCIANINDLLVDAISAGILADPDPDFPVTDDEARCVSTRMAEAFSLSRMILLGVRQGPGASPFTDLSAEETQTFANAMTDCIDVRSILLDQIAEGGAPPAALVCLNENISDEDINNLFVAAFSGEDSEEAAQQYLAPAVAACS